jgi:hypothetical protein
MPLNYVPAKQALLPGCFNGSRAFSGFCLRRALFDHAFHRRDILLPTKAS